MSPAAFAKYQQALKAGDYAKMAVYDRPTDVKSNEAGWATELKGASDALREMFFSNMSERAAKIMREDMESMGPVRLRDVDAAQMAMVQAAKDLAAKGEIMLAGASGDDELIY